MPDCHLIYCHKMCCLVNKWPVDKNTNYNEIKVLLEILTNFLIVI